MPIENFLIPVVLLVDWGNWSGMDTVDDTAEDYQKADDVSSVVSGEGGKSDMYDNTSNAGVCICNFQALVNS